jgi:Flp pilus assembly pilin Flp
LGIRKIGPTKAIGCTLKPARSHKAYSGLREEMMTMVQTFLRDEQGQDLIEYTLLLAFVALASAALFIGAGTSINAIWVAASSRLDGAPK